MTFVYGTADPTTHENVVSDTIGTAESDQTYCGARRYVLTEDDGADFAFVTMSGDSINVYSEDA